MADAALTVRNLTKEFAVGGATVTAVDRVSFDVRGGEFFTMLGPSGCGKTTTLRVIAGLESATSGEITVDGRDFMTVPPQRRNIGMVFQSYALFPHLTIFENVAYGLRLRGIGTDEIGRRVAATLALLQLETYATRHPAAPAISSRRSAPTPSTGATRTTSSRTARSSSSTSSRVARCPAAAGARDSTRRSRRRRACGSSASR